MPSTTIVRAAFFAVGALVGGGVATAIGTAKRKDTISPAQTLPTPVLDVQPSGSPRISVPEGALTKVDLPLMKYGHPGVSCIISFHFDIH